MEHFSQTFTAQPVFMPEGCLSSLPVPVIKPVISPEMRDDLLAPFDLSCYTWDNFHDRVSLRPAYIVERLNQVFGVGRWTVKYEFITEDHENKFIFAKGNLVFFDYECVLPDIFVSSRQTDGKADFADIYKGIITKIISKGSSYLGVGLDAYKGKITRDMLQGNAYVMPPESKPRSKDRSTPPKVQESHPAPVANTKEKDALAEVEKATSPEQMKDILKKYNGLTKESDAYKKAFDSKLSGLLTIQLEEFSNEAPKTSTFLQLADLAEKYPSLNTHPEFKGFFEDVYEQNRSRISELISIEAEKYRSFGRQIIMINDYQELLHFESKNTSYLKENPDLLKQIKERKEMLGVAVKSSASQAKIPEMDDELPPF